MGSISGIPSSLLQQTLLSGTGLNGNANTKSIEGNLTLSDKNQLSPLARILGDLQALQQQDPAKYKDVTSQIAVKLQAAADADTAAGNTAGASQLTKLASDFSTASKTGQQPDVQDVAKIIGGGHHHHHGQGGAAYQSGTTSASSSDPLAIILNTVSN